MNGLNESPASPACTFVTGSGGPGRMRWLDAFVGELRTRLAGSPGAVLLADSTHAAARQFALRHPGVNVQWLPMPCQCCPWLADLPRRVREAAEVNHARWIVIDASPLGAAGLLAEFDRVPGWPRECVVWLNREWSRARATDTLSPFQANLIALASRVVEEPAAPPGKDAAAPTLSLFPPPS